MKKRLKGNFKPRMDANERELFLYSFLYVLLSAFIRVHLRLKVVVVHCQLSIVHCPLRTFCTHPFSRISWSTSFAVAVLAAVFLANTAAAGTTRNRAVIIGINGYYYLGKLEYCAVDARAVRDRLVLGKEFRSADVILMTDDAPERQNRPTYANIERRFETLSDLAGEVDTLFVFFSGHGVIGENGKGYLVPIDGSRRKGLELSRVRQWLAQCKAKNTLFVLDCCHAGKGIKGVGGMAPSLAAGAGVVVIASCDARQFSYTEPRLGHSVFTLYMIEALKGKADADNDGKVNADELFSFVREKVKGWAYRKNQEQTPVRLPDRGGADIPLARVLRRARPDFKTPEIKLPDEALPDITLPEIAGDALQRVAALTRLLTAKRAEIEKKRAWYAADSVQMKALRLQERSIIAEQARSAEEAAEPVKAELGAIERAWAAGKRKGLIHGHPEMKKLTVARQNAKNRLKKIMPYLSYKSLVDLLCSTFDVDCGNGVQMKFALIPVGEFMMGSNNGADDEKPVHRVKITKPFYMGVHEVTQEQYEAVMGKNPSNFKGARNPVEQVSWNDAEEFCKKLSQKDGATYRLPTEAEWEYACRAGTTTPFHTGATISTDQANYNGNAVYGNGRKGVWRKKTIAVSSFAPNAFGLYDMHGNVWEWCQDWYDSDYYKNSPTLDPNGPRSGTQRVLRGGSWYNVPGYCRSAIRYRVNPTNSYSSNGFRVVGIARP